jgi:hypothetical protein
VGANRAHARRGKTAEGLYVLKDISQESWEAADPPAEALKVVRFCLQQLYKNRTRRGEDEVVESLTFEELIGALRAAERDMLDMLHAREFADEDGVIYEVDLTGKYCRPK